MAADPKLKGRKVRIGTDPLRVMPNGGALLCGSAAALGARVDAFAPAAAAAATGGAGGPDLELYYERRGHAYELRAASEKAKAKSAKWLSLNAETGCTDAARALLAVPMRVVLDGTEAVSNWCIAELQRRGHMQAPPPKAPAGRDTVEACTTVEYKLSAAASWLQRCNDEGGAGRPMEYNPAALEEAVLVMFQVWPEQFVLDLPGGKRELAEDTRACAVRETREETGIDLAGEEPVAEFDPRGVNRIFVWKLE